MVLKLTRNSRSESTRSSVSRNRASVSAMRESTATKKNTCIRKWNDMEWNGTTKVMTLFLQSWRRRRSVQRLLSRLACLIYPSPERNVDTFKLHTERQPWRGNVKPGILHHHQLFILSVDKKTKKKTKKPKKGGRQNGNQKLFFQDTTAEIIL